MIYTRFATVQRTPFGCIVRFNDASQVPAQHHPGDPHYRVIASRCGYGDDTLAYCVEHEVSHLVVEEALHDRPSRVLWGLAHHEPLPAQEAAYEECLAQAVQRFVRANERPIVGGVDWTGIKSRMLAVLA